MFAGGGLPKHVFEHHFQMRRRAERKMSSSCCRMLSFVSLLPLLNATASFRPCPDSCLCYRSSDLVDCRSSGLDRVPADVPRGTWLLDLSGNKVEDVHTRSFMGLWALRILLLSNNSIHTLHPQVRTARFEAFLVHEVDEIYKKV